MKTRDEIQAEALKATEGRSRCGLAVGTGVGKTYIGLMHMEQNITPLKNVLVVGPTKNILSEWQVQAVKFKKDRMLTQVTFTTYLSLNKHNPSEYDLLYLDECHNLLDTHREFLENYSGKILGLTGTPPKRSNSEKGEMVTEFCPMIYTYLVDDAVDDNILNDYRIIVHKLKLSNSKDMQVKNAKANFMTSEQANYAYWSNRVETASPGKSAQIARVMRMKAMMEYSSKEKYTKILANSIKSKCLIFGNTQDQAERLCNYSYHSNNPNSQDNLIKFKKGEITKLSCVLQLSEGVNIPDLKQGIILHAYGNERKAQQRIGRMLRLNPNETATIHILCYIGTVDEKWVTEALEGFDKNKITWKDYNIQL
jgi:superfamily II DNA or RNA helicase